jgi:hypothetical protein
LVGREITKVLHQHVGTWPAGLCPLPDVRNAIVVEERVPIVPQVELGVSLPSVSQSRSVPNLRRSDQNTDLRRQTVALTKEMQRRHRIVGAYAGAHARVERGKRIPCSLEQNHSTTTGIGRRYTDTQTYRHAVPSVTTRADTRPGNTHQKSEVGAYSPTLPVFRLLSEMSRRCTGSFSNAIPGLHPLNWFWVWFVSDGAYACKSWPPIN